MNSPEFGLHTGSFFLGIGIFMAISSIVFGCILIAYGYKKMDKLKAKDESLEKEIKEARGDIKEARSEMETISSAFFRQSEENHAILITISTRLDHIENGRHNSNTISSS